MLIASSGVPKTLTVANATKKFSSFHEIRRAITVFIRDSRKELFPSYKKEVHPLKASLLRQTSKSPYTYAQL